ncbi:MAG: DNA primase [bacterium]
MPGKISKSFIDQLLARIDIVEVIDRRVPLKRGGREYLACCPFHEEKTPSFTVSPGKQFFHCFGCGANGTAIGFLMDYGNLGFVEAIEELAESVGVEVVREDGRGRASATSASAAGDSTGPLAKIIGEANRWFQQQLREHADAKRAIAYLKSRGLDGRVAAAFGIGFAPGGDYGGDQLARALGGDEDRRRHLHKAGLVGRDEKSGRVYDRFRDRVIFPIEDHRGRVVAFGGRILGDGEPKYLNSPETPLFHKGAELYALDRARREIGLSRRALVVEGYMDVVGLAQFGVVNAVATLGTATTRTHLQRLFRLAPEIVFCFDGDRAGRAAAWKALQTALSEMRDERQVGFLFLPEGEDPDSIVRAEGRDGFEQRVDGKSSLEDFLFAHLGEQVNSATRDGKARLVALAQPLLAQLPRGALREMLSQRLTTETGLSAHQIGESATTTRARGAMRGARADAPQGQLSPLALAVSLLLQHPHLAASTPAPSSLAQLDLRGAEVLREIIAAIARDGDITTARLIESFRDDDKTHAYLQRLAARDNHIDDDALTAQFNDTLERLLEQQTDQHRLALIAQLRKELSADEERRLKQEMKALLDARHQSLQARAEAK